MVERCACRLVSGIAHLFPQVFIIASVDFIHDDTVKLFLLQFEQRHRFRLMPPE
jgi:hypothetical protein